jgi:hypothetical protein
MTCKTRHKTIAHTRRFRSGGLVLAAALGLGCAAEAHASEAQGRTGHGHVSLGYQYINVRGFQSSIGKLPIGDVETHSLDVDIDYYLTERLTLSAGIPFIVKRYQGGGPHDPLLLNPPRPEVENVDLGKWNTGFQDFHLGVQYLAMESPTFRIEPYAFLGVPSNDYPFFGHAAIGQQLIKFDVGSGFTWFPPISDAYYRLDAGYVFVEKTLGVNINHWLIRAEAGYFFSPRLTGRVFVLLKRGHGLTFPDDFPPPRDSEKWYQHDRLVKHNYMNVGAGMDWAINDRYRLTTSVMTMTWAQQVHVMRYTLNVGISRFF